MNQREMILEMLKDGWHLNPLRCLKEIGCMRLAARIGELLDEGYPIKSKIVHGKNRFGKTVHYSEYWMEP